MIESYLMLPPALGVLGLLIALGIFIVVNRYPEVDEKVKKIGDQIHLGAMVFMRREYTYLFLFVLVCLFDICLSSISLRNLPGPPPGLKRILFVVFLFWYLRLGTCW